MPVVLILLLGVCTSQASAQLVPGVAAAGDSRTVTQDSSDSGPISGPILGYIWDPASSRLRPILGIPGSSLWGGAADLRVALSMAEVSPRQDYALAVEAGSGAVLLVGLEGARISARTLVAAVPGVEEAPDRILISPAGGSAALYHRDRRALRMMTGLPLAPAFAGEIDLSGLPPLITALALSDGGLVLAAVAEGQSGSLFALSSRVPPRLVAPVGLVVAISFLENSADALIADYRRNEILVIRDVTGAAERSVAAAERDGISKPVAVAASGARRRIFAANAGSNTVVIVEPDGALSAARCPCGVSGLYRLKGEAVFRLTGASDIPLFLLDAGDAEPQVLFVPGDPGSTPAVSPAPGRVPRERGRQ